MAILPDIRYEINTNEAAQEARVTAPSLTYKLNFENKHICGRTDGQDAVEQAVVKIMSEERFSNIIYSGNYGREIEGLIGGDMEYAEAVMQRRVEEALMNDDRIKGIEDVEIEQIDGDSFYCTFWVQYFSFVSTRHKVFAFSKNT